MFNKSIILFLTLMVVVVSACSSGGAKHYVGKELDQTDAKAIGPATGTHTHLTKAFKTQYRYTVDAANGVLNLDGTITCVLDPTRHPLGAVLNRMKYEDVLISVLFTDATGRVVEADKIHLQPYGQIFYPVPFEQRLSYRPGYEGIALRVTAYMRDGTTRMRSHQIDAYDTLETGGVETANEEIPD